MTQAADFVGTYAANAMLQEVLATPKPGLVDRNNNGAHRDMDLNTFKISIAALTPHMHKFAEIGQFSAGQSLDVLFSELRSHGIEAEKEMFQATCGVNTHKGMLFSMGLLCGAAGRLLTKNTSDLTPEALCSTVSSMTAGLCDREFFGLDLKKHLSHGERIYLQYGEKGVRGEVESGFESVRLYAYPLMKSCFQKGIPINDVMVHVLLRLMSKVHDTNVIARLDLATAQYVQEKAIQLWEVGGLFSHQGQTAIELLDLDFIKRDISPGGCADLAAISLFIWFLCQPQEVS